MATYNLTSSIPPSVFPGDILNCPYSGDKKQINLKPGKYKLEVWGAQGGYRNNATYGGKGGYSVGILTLAEETTVYLYAGGSPGGSTSSTGNTKANAGGFNGGGYRAAYPGGGGGSDIRVGTDSLYARVIVAGGGGSCGAKTKKGMYGGGATGGSSTESYSADTSRCGKGGTQTYSGYSIGTTIATQVTTNNTSTTGYYGGFGFGGYGQYVSSGYGGAGGGGWYGGSGTRPDSSGDDDRGGGGGSGYIYTAATASNYPTGCLLNPQYYLNNASMTAGDASMTDPESGATVTGRSGHGYVRITVIEVQTSLDIRANIGGVWKETDALYINIGGEWKESDDLFVNIASMWKPEMYALYWLYKDGDECTDKTGGWDVWSKSANVAAAKESDNIYLYTTTNYDGTNRNRANTVNKVDVTNFSRLCFELENTANTTTETAYYRSFGLVSSLPTGTDATYVGNSYKSFDLTDDGIKTIDISGVTGSYYICFFQCITRNTHIKRVWME